MKLRLFSVLSLAFIVFAASTNDSSLAQTNSVETSKAPASLSGRVLLEDKPLANAAVAVMPGEEDSDPSNFKPKARTKTDYEGYFQLTNLQPGKYRILVQSPTHVAENANDNFYNNQRGRLIVLEPGGTIENLEFKLKRGGVVTGRVTNAEGKPVIAERVRLKRFVENTKRMQDLPQINQTQGVTDDRGIYRFYGLPAGRYLASVGVNTQKTGANQSRPLFPTGSNRFYPLTFHPAATNEEEAEAVEVTIENAVENVDIQVGKKVPAYKITGSIINEESGLPVENQRAFLQVGYVDEANRARWSFGQPIKANGDFEINGLLAGKYELSLQFPQNESKLLAVPVKVEVKDADVSDVKIKLRSGLSLSGAVIIENAALAKSTFKLSQVRVSAWLENENNSRGSHIGSNARINDDGSFSLNGLQAGTVRLGIMSYPRIKGLHLARVEVNNIAQADERIKLAQSLDNVRIILVYGDCTLRGEIKFGDNGLPPNSQISVRAHSIQNGKTYQAWTQADERGRYLIEGLPAGEYEVAVQGAALPAAPGGVWRNFANKQRISIVSNIDNQLDFTLDSNGGSQP